MTTKILFISILIFSLGGIITANAANITPDYSSPGNISWTVSDGFVNIYGGSSLMGTLDTFPITSANLSDEQICDFTDGGCPTTVTIIAVPASDTCYGQDLSTCLGSNPVYFSFSESGGLFTPIYPPPDNSGGTSPGVVAGGVAGLGCLGMYMALGKKR
jgi:hypothetical protein